MKLTAENWLHLLFEKNAFEWKEEGLSVSVPLQHRIYDECASGIVSVE